MPETLVADVAPSVGASTTVASPDVTPTSTGDDNANIPDESTLGAGDNTAQPDADGNPPEPGASDGDSQGTEDPALSGDGRQIPEGLREYFKSHPVDRARWFKAIQFEKAGFKTPQEAIALREKWESAGGEEGIAERDNELQQWSALSQNFLDAKPEFAQALFDEDAAAASRNMPNFLTTWHKNDSKSYDRALSRILVSTLNGGQVKEKLQALYNGTQDEAAKGQIKQLWDFLTQFEELAKQPVETNDPEREKFQKEKQEWEQERHTEFMRSYVTDVHVHSEKSARAELAKYLKGKALDKDAEDVMLQNVASRLGKLLEKDKSFISQRDSLIRKRNRTAVAKLANDKISVLMPDVVRNVYKLFTSVGGARAVENQNRSQVNQSRKEVPGGAPQVRQSKPPSPSQIDRQRTTDDMILRRTGYIKGKPERISW